MSSIFCNSEAWVFVEKYQKDKKKLERMANNDRNVNDYDFEKLENADSNLRVFSCLPNFARIRHNVV